MSRLVRAELLKQRTTPTILLLLFSMVGLILLIVLMHDLGLSRAQLSTSDGQLKVAGWGTGIGALFAALLGAMSITGEIRHGTIRPTFLAIPKRERVIAAKLVATALIGIGVGLLAEGLTTGIEAAGLAIRGIPIQLGAGDFLQLLAGGAIAAAFFAAIGLGVGAVVRQQVGAVVGLTIWFLMIETTLIGDVPSAGKFAPGAAAGAIAGAIQTQSASKLVAPGVGVLLLVLYAAIAATAGIVLTNRRDVA
jgi:ABC-type transport system involved in multi-copper enzyme maturation permease subunit